MNNQIDALICNSVFNRSTGMQLHEAHLLRECIMLRDGLMLLRNCLTANDIKVINAVIDYLCCDVCVRLYFFTILYYSFLLLLYIV